MQDFKRLLVWRKSHDCFIACHRALGTGKSGPNYGVKSQALDAAASVPANIAEGCGRKSTKEFIRFLDISLGSARELENHLLAARDIALITRDRHADLSRRTIEVQRMLGGLIRSLKNQPPKPDAIP